MDVFISKTILHNVDIDDNTMGTYIALRSIFNQNRQLQYITDRMLCYELCGHNNYTKYMRQSIVKGIENLTALGLISIKEHIGKAEYIIDMTNLYIPDGDFYVVIADTEVRSIFGATNTDKFALLRYFSCLVGTINLTDFVYTKDFDDGVLSNFVGYMTIKYISFLAGIPEKTAINYNSVLEEMEMIYIYRHEKYNVNNGEIRSLSNHYGRKCYEKYIKQFAEEYEHCIGEGKSIIEAKKDANAKRSLTQKYNAFMNDTEYTEDEVIALYTQVLLHNDKCQKIINGSMDEEMIAKAKKELKDTTRFEEYFGLVV